MCGLAGFFGSAGFSPLAGQRMVARMSQRLAHRGPDDQGIWLDGDAGIAFGHRRLSIIDLSDAGHQPMISASGRYVIVLNGEIYNHQEIRNELDSGVSPPHWRGRSDTETLLSAIERWGIPISLTKSVGMFAVALWDREDRVLTLARDRIGEKPLYFGWQGKTLLFGSELKSLRAHPAFQADIDRDALASYMRDGYVAAPYSIYRNIYKLLPGCLIQFSSATAPNTLPATEEYWSMADAVAAGVDTMFTGTEDEAAEQLDAHLRAAVALQRVADVPLGAFLSGGTDSTSVVALMQSQSSQPVRTFTIGFAEEKFDEAAHAKAVSAYLGTEHCQLYVTPQDAMDVIPKLPGFYDEPFGDSSAIPTILVSKLARQQVTVALSGDGGDELFAGYGRYRRNEQIWSRMRRIPFRGRNSVSRFLRGCTTQRPRSKIAWKVDRLAQYMSARTAEDSYAIQTSLQTDVHSLVLDSNSNLTRVRFASRPVPPQQDLYTMMMYRDAIGYLPDDILVKVDRASMAFGLESRVPMLDHRLVEFAWRLPLHMKVRDGQEKWLLKQVLEKYVPRALTQRPKAGFAVPVGHWIIGPLRDWAEDLLRKDRLDDMGFLNAAVVRERWDQHLLGVSGGADGIWAVLMFQAWLGADSA